MMTVGKCLKCHKHTKDIKNPDNWICYHCGMIYRTDYFKMTHGEALNEIDRLKARVQELERTANAT